MSFIDLVISKRHFAARYNQVGRAMLANLADLYCTDIGQAERWADEIDRETDIQIAAVRSRVARDGMAGPGAFPPVSPGPANPRP